ncbi:MAG: hypothetical protein EPO32_06445 [Anaerolineae bacterium]|nr:MAG: hypothetical protein EPO32_06445 [Anaerolineae bacterium]
MIGLNTLPPAYTASRPVHDWLRPIAVYPHPGPLTPLLEETLDGLLGAFAALGHTVQAAPDAETRAVLTTARYDQVMNWRRSLMFTGRIQLKLDHSPTAYTLVHMTPAEFDAMHGHFAAALARQPLDHADFTFEGMSPEAPNVLIEQGLRGGPILSLLRLLQSRTKCIHILLVVGEDKPQRIYHFDLVGAYPTSDAALGEAAFYADTALRIATYESTREITRHQVLEPPIPRVVWDGLTTPAAMARAGRELGERNFFTEMIRIADLVPVPAITESIASQYSEGCFVTYEPALEGLLATVTGSARPVDKGNITERDLAVIVGVRPDGEGAQVRHVTDKQNDPPSSEAVEMMDMDSHLPRVAWGGAHVPVLRSKLHGHRGVRAFNPARVDYVPLDSPYFHFLVSCATEAQARGIKQAFARAESLLTPDDARPLCFTILPGHGVVIAEKWVQGKAPFELIWGAMDSGDLVIDNLVPQGPLAYRPGDDGRMHLEFPLTQ